MYLVNAEIYLYIHTIFVHTHTHSIYIYTLYVGIYIYISHAFWGIPNSSACWISIPGSEIGASQLQATEKPEWNPGTLAAAGLQSRVDTLKMENFDLLKGIIRSNSHCCFELGFPHRGLTHGSIQKYEKIASKSRTLLQNAFKRHVAGPPGSEHSQYMAGTEPRKLETKKTPVMGYMVTNTFGQLILNIIVYSSKSWNTWNTHMKYEMLPSPWILVSFAAGFGGVFGQVAARPTSRACGSSLGLDWSPLIEADVGMA